MARRRKRRRINKGRVAALLIIILVIAAGIFFVTTRFGRTSYASVNKSMGRIHGKRQMMICSVKEQTKN